ncbi:MAG: division/cell wall cluster transcriptional repressor MraZ [Muribaculum sp.]|nr:division/cell wall cluster transcriptional repressor MraZ [Muribaculum sp.]
MAAPLNRTHGFRGRPDFKVVIVMFMSEYNHTIDAKGRLIIPSKFREVLGEEFVVSKGMDGCLFVYANDDWNAFEQKLTSLPLINKEARQFARFFLAGAAQVEVDKQGRILLPAALREFAGLDKDVVLVGVGSRIEIWSKEKYEDVGEDMDMDDIAAAMGELGLTI